MAAIFIVLTLPSCTADNKDEKLSIVCTIFPEYDWVREILGSHVADAELTMLLDNGIDLHSYQPTASDIIKISTCDIFIYVGGESERWVEDALNEAVNKDMIIINLLKVLGNAAKEEETVEGMETEHEESAKPGEESPVYDEHVWLSLKNAILFCDFIAEKLGEADIANAADYSANAKAYTDKLKSLDASYKETVDSEKFRTLLFGDRFPFRYLADDYGLSYYAAFLGCSAETEASFETVTFLAAKVDELGLGSVLTIEGGTNRIAQTIIQNTKLKNQKILTLDSMQSVTPANVSAGETYFLIMQENLAVLKKALN